MPILFGSVFVVMGSFAMLLPGILYVLGNMGLSPSLSTPILAAYSLAQFFAGPQWGRLSDQIGRKKVLFSAMFMGSLAYLCMSLFADNVVLLFFTMVWAGACAGTLAVIVAAVSDITTAETRTKGMGLVGASIGLAFIFGTAIGGSISGANAEAATIVEPAMMSFLACLIGSLVVLIFFKETKFSAETVSQGRNGNTLEDVSAASAARSVATPGRLDAFKKIARHPALLKLSFLILIFTFCLALFEPVVPIFVKDQFNWGPPELRNVYIFVGCIFVLVQGGLIGPLAKLLGERKLVLIGLLLTATGLLLLGVLASKIVLYVSLIFVFVGTALFNASSMSLASHEAEDHEKGAVLGVVQSMQALGRSIGPMVAGVMYDFHQTVPFITGGVLVILLFIMFIRLTRQLHRQEDIMQV